MSQVTISPQTVSILKSFSQINSNLMVRAGNKIQTISPTKTLLGTFTSAETFQDFAIYDLPEFIGVLSLFKQPTLDFDTSFVTIQDGGQSAKYFFANPSTFKLTPPDKEITFGEPDATLELDEQTFNTILKAAATLKVGEISFADEGDEIVVRAYDVKNPTSNSFKVGVPGTHRNAKFNLIMKIENMRMVSGAYKVELSKAKLAKFTHKELPLHYFVALQSESTFAE